MGNLRACFAVATLALAACGSDSAKTDAGIVLIDSPMPDAKVFNDAPPKNYDLTCFGATPPTTAPAMITVSGSTQSFSTSGNPQAVTDVDVAFYENGNSTALATDTSAAGGAFELADIATGGEPVDGYVRAAKTAYRTTYMYPPNPVAADYVGIPVVMFSNAFFDNIKTMIGGQDDSNNGVLLFAVTDCSTTTQTLIGEATVSVEQSGTMQGTVIGLGILGPDLAGTFLVTEVPDGDTDIKASYNGMNFPTHTVRAYKKPENGEGTLTFTVVRPGP